MRNCLSRKPSLGLNKSSSRIELKSNQSLQSLKEKTAEKVKKEDTKMKKGDKIYNEQDPSKMKLEEAESIDSMENEIETMSILVKGYKKVYPLIEFLEKFLIQEYIDDEDGYNGPPIKIRQDSDSELESELQEFKDQNRNASIKSNKRISEQNINASILSQQKRFIRAQLKEAVKEEGVNAENLLGFINQKKLNSYLNISNIMRLKKLDFKDVYSTCDLDLYLLRESILERFMLVITSYFCMGTELRFLRQLKVQGFKDSIEAQFWHGRALEMAISLFPGDSPLVKHIIQSYQKHHAPSSEIIPEDYSISHEVKVAKP